MTRYVEFFPRHRVNHSVLGLCTAQVQMNHVHSVLKRQKFALVYMWHSAIVVYVNAVCIVVYIHVCVGGGVAILRSLDLVCKAHPFTIAQCCIRVLKWQEDGLAYRVSSSNELPEHTGLLTSESENNSGMSSCSSSLLLSCSLSPILSDVSIWTSKVSSEISLGIDVQCSDCVVVELGVLVVNAVCLRNVGTNGRKASVGAAFSCLQMWLCLS